MRPKIAITMGDPSGVGPEILAKSLRWLALQKNAQFLIIGHRIFLNRFRYSLPFLIPLNENQILKNRPFDLLPGRLGILNMGTAPFSKVTLGKPSKLGGKQSLITIKKSIELALSQKVDGIVHNPVNKKSLQMGGARKSWVGHTEILQSLTRSPLVLSMMVLGTFRTVMMTSHIPFRKVPKILNRQLVYDSIKLTREALKSLGIPHPRLAVCGLNPHAGDNGILGQEESQIINPGIQRALKRRWKVFGPYPADTLWSRVQAGEFDAGLATYHDQGQIPLKLLGFGSAKGRKKNTFRGVQVSLGLPFVRTSVSHGTGYDIVRKGVASPLSFLEAVKMAVQLAKRTNYGKK